MQTFNTHIKPINSMGIQAAYILLIIGLFSSFCTAQSADLTVDEYIEKYRNIAIQEMERSEIPASITLAQGIHESAYGNSRLAKKANNHFGIKCTKDWKGKTFQKWDDEAHKSCFRVYKNPEESYIDHTDFLMNRKHYAFLFSYGRKDYKRWAKGLRKAGYATDPKYPEKLIATIEKYKLSQYDRAAGLLTYDSSATDKEEPLVLVSGAKKYSFLFKPCKRGTLTRKSRARHHISYTVAKEGETLLSVAERMGSSYARLVRINDFEGRTDLIEFQPIYIYPKRYVYSGEKRFHKVENDERMYEIAQYYGIKLAALLTRNQMTEGEEPMNGELIQLKERAVTKPKLRSKKHQDKLPPYAKTAKKESKDSKATTKPVNKVSQGVKRPEPQKVEINTPTYDNDIYANDSTINTSKSKDKAFLDMEIRPTGASTTTTVYRRPTRRPSRTDSSPTTTTSTAGNNAVNQAALFGGSSTTTTGTNTGSTTYRPATTTGTNTGSTTYRPATTGTNTGSTTYRPATTAGTNTGSTTYRPATTGTNTGSTTAGIYGSTKGSGTTTTSTNKISPKPVNSNNSNTGKFQMHVVQKGETLYRLYVKYRVAVDKIKAANNLTSNEISVGQTLKIPVK